MNVFLTGERGVGKSTVIERFVDGLESDASGRSGSDFVAGFRTSWGAASLAGFDALYISPYGASAPLAGFDSRAVCERRAYDGSLTVFSEVFDRDGVAILRAIPDIAPRPRLIIMDELGFMETGSPAFMRAVMDTLDGDIPVLGVMRWESNPFLDAVKSHEGTVTRKVDSINRDVMPGELTAVVFRD
jgi:nucleoside-triphosphatase